MWAQASVSFVLLSCVARIIQDWWEWYYSSGEFSLSLTTHSEMYLFHFYAMLWFTVPSKSLYSNRTGPGLAVSGLAWGKISLNREGQTSLKACLTCYSLLLVFHSTTVLKYHILILILFLLSKKMFASNLPFDVLKLWSLILAVQQQIYRPSKWFMTSSVLV